MQVGKLNVTLRTAVGKGTARRLRSRGLVPGICYGSGMAAPVPIILSPKELRESLDPVKRNNTVIDVTVSDGAKTTHKLTAMLKDYQIHPIRREITHVDLIAIDTEKPVEAEVPVELTGKAVGIVEGGQLHVVTRKVRVRCKPADIPAKLELDVTALRIGDVLHVSDLVFPPGVEALDDQRLTIVTCALPEEEKVAPAVEEAAAEEAAAAPAAEKVEAAAEGKAKEGEKK